ncbi:hypothetical protein QFZ87_004237 [Bacillus sp. SLBN-46]|uniref:hypothetical protein n=1 Tax=Bacillus sp. SLBN-46 TaxID=3042283 RepID=UPI0028625AEB|nr:hypothetical protein [Bacillus sp. SLBN-46]MDR6124640.1 hypothetical protein [Bacillus sp. SLBN-46]
MAYSDRTGMKRQGRVRMLGLFGQDEQEKTGLSPNTWLIRTGRGGKGVIESEYQAHSDRVRRKRRNCVRMPGSFGQGEQEKKWWCPNTRLIRTGLTRKRSDRVRMPGSFGQGEEEKE